MRNIGSVVAQELEAAGIPDAESLKAIGVLGAAIRLRTAGFDVCRSKLAGLAGAIQDIKWNLVPQDDRKKLWAELEARTAESNPSGGTTEDHRRIQ